MGKNAPSAPSPDPNIGIAALKGAETGEAWLDFMKGQAKISNQWAMEDRDRYQSVFQPLENQFVKTAQNWDSPERQAKMAAEARADVMGASALQDQMRSRQLAAVGIAPNSGRFAGIDRAADTETALAAAGAQNNARNTVRNQGLALKGDAVGLGRGLPSQALGALGLSNSAANSGFGGAMQGYGQQGSLLNDQYRTQVSAWQTEAGLAAQNSAGLMSGLGSIIGLGASFMSDEDAKEDKKPARGFLDAIRGMPVEQWTYKEGEGDEGTHVGTYAQDFQRETGKGDGKSINVIDAIGTLQGGLKELIEEVDGIKGVIAAKMTGGRGLPKGVMA